MLLLVSVAYLTLLVMAFQDEIDRWFIRQWPVRTFEAFSRGSRGRIDEGMNGSNNEQSMTLLLVDDDEVFRERLARALRDRDVRVTTASSCETALVAASAGPFDCAVLDLRMPGQNGLTLIEPLRARHPAIRIAILTGYGSQRSAVEATRLGAHDFLSKPVNSDEILESLRPNGDRSHTAKPATLETARREHVDRILSDTGGNISEAARRLGIARRTLQLKLGRERRSRR